MTFRILTRLACLTLAIAAPARAADKPLFASSDKIRISIVAPLASLINNRGFRGKVAGTLTDPTGQSLPIGLSLRGITRRTAEICSFPPLRVDFTAPPPASSIFAGQKKLKLITHCQNSAAFRQYVLLEYSAYGMYNLLTPRSFRARLADIEYKDPGGRPVVYQIGYFLEDLDDVAHRNNMRQVHAGDRIPLEYLSAPDSARYTMFQHMIGNHDWSIRAGPAGKDCCHNAELIGAAAPGQIVPIPYDFDYSGLVDPPYATPPAELSISDVKQRYYRGYCAQNADAIAAAQQMRQLRPQILKVLTEVPGLDGRSQGRAAAYLEHFFSDIATDADVGSKLLKRCAR